MFKKITFLDYTTDKNIQYEITAAWHNSWFNVWFNGFDQGFSILKICFQRYNHNYSGKSW